MNTDRTDSHSPVEGIKSAQICGFCGNLRSNFYPFDRVSTNSTQVNLPAQDGAATAWLFLVAGAGLCGQAACALRFARVSLAKAAAVMQDIASYETDQEALALLKILALGNQQIEQGKMVPAAQALASVRLRGRDKRSA